MKRFHINWFSANEEIAFFLGNSVPSSHLASAPLALV